MSNFTNDTNNTTPPAAHVCDSDILVIDRKTEHVVVFPNRTASPPSMPSDFDQQGEKAPTRQE